MRHEGSTRQNKDSGQIKPDNSPESSAKSLLRKFFVIPYLGDKIQGPSRGQQNRQKPPFTALLEPRFERPEVAQGGLEWPKGGLKWPKSGLKWLIPSPKRGPGS